MSDIDPLPEHDGFRPTRHKPSGSGGLEDRLTWGCLVIIFLAAGTCWYFWEQIDAAFDKSLETPRPEVARPGRDSRETPVGDGPGSLSPHARSNAPANDPPPLKTQEDIDAYNAAVAAFKAGNKAYGLGKVAEALRLWNTALQKYQEIPGTERDQADCYGNIGVALDGMAKYEEAIAKHQRALAMYQEIPGTGRDQAACYTNIGVALLKMAKYEEAIAKYQRALAMYQKIPGTGREQGASWARIGEARRRAGHFAQAIAAYTKARRRIRGWWVSRGLGKAYRRRDEPGDGRKAINALHEAVEQAEEKRASVTAFQHRTAIFEEPSAAFSDLVDLLLELDPEQTAIDKPEVLRWAADPESGDALLEVAFHFADRGKGRGLVALIREKAAVRAARPDAELAAEDQALSHQISKLTALREKLAPDRTEQRESLTRRIEAAQQRRNMIEVELKKTALGDYVAPEFRKPAEMAHDLPEDTAVLQYSLGEERAWLLILTREGVSCYAFGAPIRALPELLR